MSGLFDNTIKHLSNKNTNNASKFTRHIKNATLYCDTSDTSSKLNTKCKANIIYSKTI